jgi:exopolyphosphatase/guanosine-5'-triphosphate,3'-diphosphate pyrophosphatase
VLCACIDIGSNTTRVLVAEVRKGRLTEVLARRAFTRIGRELRSAGVVSDEKVREIAAVVAEQRQIAEAAGAEAIAAVATAAIRGASNRAELVAAIRAAAGIEVNVLDGSEEARLAFVGATRTLPPPLEGTVAVVDVGGGSSEIAFGTLDGGVSWSTSIRIGSGFLADAYLRDDPPAAADFHAMREHAAGCFEGLEVPQPGRAVAVGGSATSLRRLIGPTIEPAAVSRALHVLSAASCESVAREHGLLAERVRLLPAGLVILAECAAVLGKPLQIGVGGIREGVCLELAGSIGA